MRSRALWMFAVTVAALSGADPATSSIGKIFDQEISAVEREIAPLAEEMPAAKYGFVPDTGAFRGARTFHQQVTHTAALLYMYGASILGEANPSEPGPNDNGPASLATKEDAVKYLKDAFGYVRKAINSVTSENLTGMVKSAYGDFQVPRVSMVSAAIGHTWDHYGQMAVYARLNGVIPPASRR